VIGCQVPQRPGGILNPDAYDPFLPPFFNRQRPDRMVINENALYAALNRIGTESMTIVNFPANGDKNFRRRYPSGINGYACKLDISVSAYPLPGSCHKNVVYCPLHKKNPAPAKAFGSVEKNTRSQLLKFQLPTRNPQSKSMTVIFDLLEIQNSFFFQ
jgi:hypothetical protein